MVSRVFPAVSGSVFSSYWYCMAHRDSLASFPNQILTLDLQEGSESHGEWIGKLAKTTRMTKIQNSQERSKTGFPGPLVVICDDLGWLVTIPDG